MTTPTTPFPTDQYTQIYWTLDGNTPWENIIGGGGLPLNTTNPYTSVTGICNTAFETSAIVNAQTDTTSIGEYDNITISIWVYPVISGPVSDSYQRNIIGKIFNNMQSPNYMPGIPPQTSISISTYFSNSLQIKYNGALSTGGGGFTTATLLPNQWNMISLTSDGSVYRLGIYNNNGVTYENATQQAPNNWGSHGRWIVGEWCNYSSNPLTMIYDEVRIDNTARTDVYLQSEYNYYIGLPLPAAELIKTSGDSQSTNTNTQFTQDLIVQAFDIFGNPLSNATITFSAPDSGASCNLSNTTTITDSNGVAYTQATANSISGSYQVTVSSGSINPIYFNLTNINSSSTTFVSANNTVVGGTLIPGYNSHPIVNNYVVENISPYYPQPFAVLALDTNSNPMVGVSVTFSAPGSGASCSLSNTTTITDSNGVAYTQAKANTISGSYQVTATCGGLTVNFNITNIPDIVTTVIKISGDNQNTEVGTAFEDPLIIQFTDQYWNPCYGYPVWVVFPITAANVIFGTSTPAQSQGADNGTLMAVTDSNGEVSYPITANHINGTYEVVMYPAGFSRAPGTLEVSYTLTNDIGPPIFQVVSGSNQYAQVNEQYDFPLVAKMTDLYGNPYPNISTTF